MEPDAQLNLHLGRLGEKFRGEVSMKGLLKRGKEEGEDLGNVCRIEIPDLELNQ